MSLNSDNLAIMTKAGKAADPYKDVTPMRIKFNDSSCALVEYPGLDLKGLIMPMRV